MRLVSLIMMLVCVLGAIVVSPACIPDHERVAHASAEDQPPQCCTDKGEDADGKNAADGCGSTCNPFQYCGCCALMVNGIPSVGFNFAHAISEARERTVSYFQNRLPDHQPPLESPPPRYHKK